MSIDRSQAPVAFSRYLSLPAAAAMGTAITLPVVLFVLGREVLSSTNATPETPHLKGT